MYKLIASLILTLLREYNYNSYKITINLNNFVNENKKPKISLPQHISLAYFLVEF